MQRKKLLVVIILTVTLFLGACIVYVFRPRTGPERQNIIPEPTRYFSVASPAPAVSPTPALTLVRFPRTSSRRAILSLEPASLKKASTEPAVLAVVLDPGSFDPQAVELDILFDPGYLQLSGIKNSKLFTRTDQATASGKIKVSLTDKTNREATVSGEILNLTFKLLRAGSTLVKFDPGTKVLDSGKNVVGILKAATIYIKY